MTTEEIIASGNLELYVCGALSPSETLEVEKALHSNNKVKQEIEQIESALMQLSVTLAPKASPFVWSNIINNISGVRSLNTTKSKTNWGAISGWAAAIVLIGGIAWMMNQKGIVENELLTTQEENKTLQYDLNTTKNNLEEANTVLAIVKSKDFNTIKLPGNQAVAPQAYAQVFYNKTTNQAYVDISGLPPAPAGKVYQVWSLLLDPLTPKSVGLADNATAAATNLHKFDNIQDAP